MEGAEGACATAKSMSLKYEPASAPLHIPYAGYRVTVGAETRSVVGYLFSSYSLLLSSLELSDTKVYEP